jgi:hypothetical protein
MASADKHMTELDGRGGTNQTRGTLAYLRASSNEGRDAAEVPAGSLTAPQVPFSGAFASSGLISDQSTGRIKVDQYLRRARPPRTLRRRRHRLGDGPADGPRAACWVHNCVHAARGYRTDRQLARRGLLDPQIARWSVNSRATCSGRGTRCARRSVDHSSSCRVPPITMLNQRSLSLTTRYCFSSWVASR